MNTRNLSTALWRKSRHSNGQANCVEVAHNLPGAVAVRDSKQPRPQCLPVLARYRWPSRRVEG